MVDFVGMMATAGLTLFIVTALLVFAEMSRPAKLAWAGVLGLWVGIAVAASAVGWLATARPFPVMGLFVAAPLIAAAVSASWPAARAAMLSLPLPVLVGLNVGRVVGFLFLLLAAQGRLSGPFPYFAGWGDIITGAAAALLLQPAREAGRHLMALHLWNAFGLADLVLAIALGVTSAANSPLQVFGGGAGSEAMQHLPWSLVPAVLVPLWMILHAIVWVQLRQRAVRTA